MPSLTGMKAGGFYDKHSSVQAVAADSAGPWIDEAAAKLLLPAPPAAVTVVDYGCSEGNNSIRVVGRGVEALRRRTTQTVCGIHTDLPGNNFNALFANLFDPAASNYLHDRGQRRPGVYALAAAGSFYGPIMPPRSVRLGLSFFALQWLDARPDVPVPGGVGYMRSDAAATEAFRQQAERDWLAFLRFRAEEMAPGGRLLVVLPSGNAAARCYEGSYDALDAGFRDLVAAGDVPQSAHDQFAFPVYFRTAEELTAAVNGPNAPHAGAFRVERAGTWEAPTPFEDEFRRTGDKQTYAATYTGFLRAFSEPVVAAALQKPELVGRYYEHIARRLADEPGKYAYHNVVAAVLLERL